MLRNSDESGMIRTVAESDHGCTSDTTELNVSINSSTGSPEYGRKEFNMYPNPVSDILTLVFQDVGERSIVITSVNGAVLYNNKMISPTHQVDLSSIQKGVYFITVSSEEFTTTRKIIKL
jgi:hypothetical protein